MKNKRLLLSISVAAAALWYTGAVAIAAEHEHAMKVGKTGEITFDKETQVGDVTLKPGRYKLRLSPGLTQTVKSVSTVR